jgi:phage major head subunit gpT-like protein
MFTETYDVENEKYECTLEVDRDEIDDDQTGQIRLRTRQLADRAAGHKDSCLASLMVNGPSANYLAYDGQIFFSAAHESGKSGAQTNLATPAAVDADAPTAAEFRTALGAGIAQMLGLLDDQGEPMSVDASGLVCVVPPSMYLAALEAVNATVMSSTTNVMAGAARVVAFSRLTTASVFYLLKTNVAVRPFIFQERDPIEFRAKEGESDEGFMREKYFYGVRARYKLTYGYWQHAIHNTFTE